MANYEVIVGNIGKVYEGGSYQSALDDFKVYQGRSIAGTGKAAGEPVTLLKDGEPIREHSPEPEPPKCDLCGESDVAVKFQEIGCCDDCAEKELQRTLADLTGPVCATVARDDDGNLLVCLQESGTEHDHGNRPARLIEPTPEPINTELLEALRALTDWGREHTSPRDENSPHDLLVRAVAAIDKADKLTEAGRKKLKAAADYLFDLPTGGEDMDSGDEAALYLMDGILDANTLGPAPQAHQLIISSLHDAQARCSCGRWWYAVTGSRTRAEVEAEFATHDKK